MQASTAAARDAVATHRSAAAAPLASDAVPQPAAAAGGIVRTRRHWLRYGIPGAVLATTAAWTFWSSRSAPQRVTVTLPSDQATQAASDGSQLVPVRDDGAPAGGQAGTESLGATGAAAANATIDARPAAQLKLAVSPWGEIYVDGRRRGVSPPLRQLDLAPGKHRIEIRNTTFPTRSESVDARPHAHLRIKHKVSR
jgi:serine/threonine-protein kinase